MNSKHISTSLEDYLEAILRIFNEKKGVRTKDIASLLHVRNSSVTTALKHLASEGLIHYEKYGVISLTEEGEKQANFIWVRHQILYFFFHSILDVAPDESKTIACLTEHAITGQAFTKLLQYMKRTHPKELSTFIQKNHTNQKYLQCYLDNCMEEL
ncbi:MAG: metal-dependent transcriptional regulator [Caldisericia bacterium]|nr:metal-dependent transcriptional regulator [Caldisericia bacterium]